VVVPGERLVAAFMESLAAGVPTAQDEEVCRGERKTRRRIEERVTVAASWSVGLLWWSWCSWWYIVWVCWYSRRRRQLWQRWKEKGKKTKKVAEIGKKLFFFFFFAYFGPQFLLPQTMKSTFIYRQWKRAILST